MPVPSTPDNDPSRIIGLLNVWLLCPFIALGILGILLLAFSPTHRKSLGLSKEIVNRRNIILIFPRD